MKWYEKTWVTILLLILVWPVGLIIMWTQKKFNKVARIVITILIIIIAIAVREYKNTNNPQITTSVGTELQDTQSTKEEEEKQRQEEEKQRQEEEKQRQEEEKQRKDKEIKDMEDKYEPILKDKKDYASMTNDERKLATEMIFNWSKLSDDFKTKYKDSKDAIETSIERYAEKKNKEEAAKKAKEEAASYDTGITYDQLARNPEDYKNKKVKFTGKVIQVIEGDNETDLRIAVNDNYDTILYVGYDPSISNKRVLENDNVTIRGKSIGIFSYQSTMGGKISIPGVWVENIVIN